MPSLLCLISALTQAGGGDLLFRFARSVQSCCGEGGGTAGRCRCVWGALAVLWPGSHGEWPGQPEVCARSPLAQCTFSLRGPSARRHRSGLRKSLDRNPRLFAGWEGVASLGLSLPLAPPPASFLQRGWGCSSLEFLSPFVLRTAGGVFRPVNFSLLSHSLKKAPSICRTEKETQIYRTVI